jgi:hypothetical protein
MSRAMKDGLARLRDGAINFSEFAEQTRADFDRMAADVARGWKVPPGVDEEDVRQEFLLSLIERDLVNKFDPRRGPSLERFVVWQSYTFAKRFVHRQRGAARRDGKAPSRHPLAFSSLRRAELEQGEDAADRGLEGWTPASQEDAYAAAELAEAFRGLIGGRRERGAFDALRASGGIVEDAVQLILDDPAYAGRCRVSDRDEAEDLVKRTLEGTRRLVREVLRA